MSHEWVTHLAGGEFKGQARKSIRVPGHGEVISAEVDDDEIDGWIKEVSALWPSCKLVRSVQHAHCTHKMDYAHT